MLSDPVLFDRHKLELQEIQRIIGVYYRVMHLTADTANDDSTYVEFSKYLTHRRTQIAEIHNITLTELDDLMTQDNERP